MLQPSSSRHSNGEMASEEDNEELDPRIQEKLEELNQTTVVINMLEKQFEESNARFRTTLNESSTHLKRLFQKIGSKAIEEAKKYHYSKERAAELQISCQRAAVKYERACELVTQAKETIATAEERFENSGQHAEFDAAWQEMLNHATGKLMEAETAKCQSELEHRKCMQRYLDEERKATLLQRQSRRAIQKSKPYFEEKATVQRKLNDLKTKIQSLNQTILESKQSYAKTLKDLEMISEEIHEKRAQLLVKSLQREPGVGAELDNHAKDDERRVSLGQNIPRLIVHSFPKFPNSSGAAASSIGTDEESEDSFALSLNRSCDDFNEIDGDLSKSYGSLDDIESLKICDDEKFTKKFEEVDLDS